MEVVMQINTVRFDVYIFTYIYLEHNIYEIKYEEM